jgi:CheY-like chemotaxis protein
VIKVARILLVDDEPEIRVLTRMMLEKAGYSVVEAVDGAEALEKLKVEAIDLVLLDIMMPGMKGGEEGWAICEKIKANKKLEDIPVVMFTVRTSEEDMKHSFKCKADAHINKPFELEELLETLEKLLKKVAYS